jgi:hypothetical protein
MCEHRVRTEVQRLQSPPRSGAASAEHGFPDEIAPGTGYLTVATITISVILRDQDPTFAVTSVLTRRLRTEHPSLTLA